MKEPGYQKLIDPDSGYDCSEIASDLFDASGGAGSILRMTPNSSNGWIKVPEANKLEEYIYHEVYTDGKFVYDPRFSFDPIPLTDYVKTLRELNPGINFETYVPYELLEDCHEQC